MEFADLSEHEIAAIQHPHTLTARHNIAQQMGNQGRYAEAEKEFRKVWDIERRPEILGEEYPDKLRTRFWLVKILDGINSRNLQNC